MALANIRVIATEQEAVQFAIARRAEHTSYNLEKRGGTGFDRNRVRTLLQGCAGYREYQQLGCVLVPAGSEGNVRKAHIELSRQASDELKVEILKDCVERANARICSDERYQAFHDQYVQPLGDLIRMRKQLAISEPDARGVVLVQYWVEGGRDQRTYAQIEQALNSYLSNYYPPLRLERAGKGDYMFHQSHGTVDANNPHNFPHVHVWHATEVYKTTLRLAS